MPALCAAVGCNNRDVKGGTGSDPSRRLSFHHFPLKQPDLLKKWVTNLRRQGFKPTAHHVLCSDHFTEDCFDQTQRMQIQFGMAQPRAIKLNPDAVPTLFKYKEEKEAAAALKRRPHTEERLAQKEKKIKLTALKESLSRHPDDAPMEFGPPSPPPPPLPADPTVAQRFPIWTDASTQTERATHSQSTMTMKSVKEVGMWAHPETADKSFMTDPENSGTTETASSPMKLLSTSAITQTTPSKDQPKPSTSQGSPQLQTGDVDEPSSPFAPSEHYDLYEPSESEYEESSSSTSGSDTGPDDKNNKYIVFHECLFELLRRCPDCGEQILETKKVIRGSLLTVTLVCGNNHTTHWKSQPLINRYSEGHLVLSAAIFFAGGTYGRFHQICTFMGLKVPSPATYFKIQKEFLFPVVHEYWLAEKEAVKQELQGGDGIVVIGDARCDSPGFSAKYSTYTIMAAITSKIIDFEVIQVSEVKSSHAMELEGFKRTLDRVLAEDIPVKTVATDRHISVNKYMDTQHKDLSHQFDVWHFAKNIKKKLAEKAKLKKYADLLPWIQSVSNHLWWASATCGGSAALLKEKWMSILHHITNTHHWETGTLFHRCEHPPLPPDEARRKKWLKPGSDSHKLLQSVVMDKKILSALDKLTEFCHTGSLEVYHSLYNKYMPKRQHFSFHGMNARTMLASLDHNNNVGRQQATVQKGEKKGQPRFNVVSPKGRNGWVAKPVFEGKTYKHVDNMIKCVLNLCQSRGEDAQPLPSRELPKNIARLEKPAKEDVVKELHSRFPDKN